MCSWSRSQNKGVVNIDLYSFMTSVIIVISMTSSWSLRYLDLSHVCRAFIEQTGMYVRWQADQTRFLPQGDVSEIYNIYVFIPHICIYEVKSIPDSKEGQIFATDRYRNSLFLASLNKTRVIL